MPFTLSHAALVLPTTFLPKKMYSITGLLIGSFVPDFEYFIRMRDYSIYSHTKLGIFWFDVPLGILLAFVYHNLVRNALLENLPNHLYLRILPFRRFDWEEYFKKNWFVVVISIIIGAASHIFWDGFTHWNGYFVRHIPFLRRYMMIMGSPFSYYNLAQHFSTIVGGFIIIIFMYKLPQSPQGETTKQRHQGSYWPFVFGISILILLLRIFSGLNYKSFDQVIVNAISGGIMALIVMPVFFRSKYQ